LVLIAALLLWAVMKFFVWAFTGSRSEAMAATVLDLSGPAEFSIEKDSEWVPVYSDQLVYKGDSIRTKNNSQLGLRILNENNWLHLDYNTELKITELEEKSGETRIIELELLRGRVWGHIDPLLLSASEKSQMKVVTPKATTHILGTMFVIEAGVAEDLVRVMEGRVSVEVTSKTENNKEKRTEVPMSVGQQMRVNDSNILTISGGGDVLEKLDTEFITSEWHLYNLEQFNPDEAAEIRGPLEVEESEPVGADPNITAPETDTVPELPTSTTLEPVAFTSPAAGATVGDKADDLVVISGIAPAGASEIWVNNYKLNLFRPGDRKWRYFAKGEFNTLKNGQNSYTAFAVDSQGNRSESRTLTFNYLGMADGGVVPATNNTSTNTTNTNEVTTVTAPSNDVMAPVFVYPKVSPFETSASKVTLRGTVDPSVTAVEVNGYRLKQFQAGSGTWKYLANADMGNMSEGENTFTVQTYIGNNKSKSTSVNIVYRPMDKVPGQ